MKRFHKEREPKCSPELQVLWAQRPCPCVKDFSAGEGGTLSPTATPKVEALSTRPKLHCKDSWVGSPPGFFFSLLTGTFS